MVVSWKTPTADLSLSKNDIHLWRADLSLPERSIQQLNQILSTDERMRAERFHFEKDRKKFVVGVGILRTILGYYLSVEPNELRFFYGKRGKPRLAHAFANGHIRFNISHSEGLALYGFTRDREIGVDIEYIRDIPEMNQIIDSFFSEKEKAILNGFSGGEKKEAFFSYWTCKEALMKAIGNGLSVPINAFDISIAIGGAGKLLKVKEDSKGSKEWFIQELKPAPGFAGALALERPVPVCYYRGPEENNCVQHK